ncbi:MAG TPA: omptin family outer membrane protease [Gammaproteobacteria bacterium]|nr:omptin family outer membrane protease [Gammaproteobacteria bacterium]
MNIYKYSPIVPLLSILLMNSTAVYANQNKFVQTSMDVSLGSIHLEALEKVYDDGFLLSQLEWTTQQSPLLSSIINFKYGPKFTFQLKGAFSSSGEGELYDYDWINPTSYGVTNSFENWTHKSHSNTELKYYYQVGFKAFYQLFHKNNLDLKGLLNAQRISMDWDAVGGTYIYSSGGAGFRGASGSFANGVGINYGQTWDTFALGIDASTDYEDYSFHFAPQYGINTNIHDQDIHVLRGITFNEDLAEKGGSTFLALDVKANKHISKSMDAYAVYSYENHFEGKGETDVCGAHQCSHFSGDAAGASLKTHSFMIGLTIKD